MHPLTAVAHVPAADIFQIGATISDRGKVLAAAIAALIIFILMARSLAKSSSFVSSMLTILGGVVLLFLLGQFVAGSLNKPLDDTVRSVVNGAPVFGPPATPDLHLQAVPAAPVHSPSPTDLL